MTTYPVVPPINTPTAAPTAPYWVVSIFLKDHNGMNIDGGFAGQPTVQFCIVAGGTSAVIVPGSFDSAVGVPMNDSCASALKTWAENMDWNTGFDWSHTQAGSGLAVGPVTFTSVNITQINTVSLVGSGTDITPA